MAFNAILLPSIFHYSLLQNLKIALRNKGEHIYSKEKQDKKETGIILQGNHVRSRYTS
jgi:hypothetical protein